MIEIISREEIICSRVRRSKTNDTFFNDIPIIKGKKPYKNNKNCPVEYKTMVRVLEQKQVLMEKYDVKKKSL